jgi:hypothetical protein
MNGGAADDGRSAASSKETDRDGDGLPDDLELRLANEFAPVVFYSADEPNLPARVDPFLVRGQLWFFSQYCTPEQVFVEAIAGEIPRKREASCRVAGETIESHGTWSASKAATFYLATLPPEARHSSADARDWITYVHAYPNDLGGVTLQYWRFYLFNTSYWMGIRAAMVDHGGDWEGIHVVLGPGPGYAPVGIRLLGHRDIAMAAWSSVLHEDHHPLIVAAKGGHSSELATEKPLANRSRFIEQQSWTGGRVRWPGQGNWQPSGGLALLGQKTRPMPGMEWIQYSGLWGTRERGGVLPAYRSGYWGPAFNETGMRSDGFFSAWCAGMAERGKIAVREECFAAGR